MLPSSLIESPMRKAPTTTRKRSDPDAPAPIILFTAKLMSPQPPAPPESPPDWSFLVLPKTASAKLPSRSMVSVKGTLNNTPFQATLQPDGNGSHWLKLNHKLLEAAGLGRAGGSVSLELTPLAPQDEPEPEVPADLQLALAAAPKETRDAWSDITPIARRDFIHWITSAKQTATRARRISAACDMLANGKRRPCCFDRSGIYSNSLTPPCPAPDQP